MTMDWRPDVRQLAIWRQTSGLRRSIGALIALDAIVGTHRADHPQDSPAALIIDWSIKAAVVFPWYR